VKNESILVVDNDDTICWVLNTALTDEGYRVDTASNGRKALDKLSAHRYHLVIMDIMMPVMDGLETLKHIRARKNPPEVIMITAHSSMENTIEAMKMGAFDYVVKPFDIDEILSLAARAIKTYHERRETTGPGGMERDTRIIGSSPIMRDLYKILGRIATTDSAVLLTGETGTGKDLFARAIHFHSSRHDKPFITVNCASIPAELLES